MLLHVPCPRSVGRLRLCDGQAGRGEGRRRRAAEGRSPRHVRRRCQGWKAGESDGTGDSRQCAPPRFALPLSPADPGVEISSAFFCSVGNVLPNETVKIELTYVTELTEGDTSDSIRFHVPAIVGQRYGQQPHFGAAPAPVSSKTAFEFQASIEATSAITKVASPSHPVSLELGPDPPLPHAKDLPAANYARVSFGTETTLEKDVVLNIHAAGLDQPRCVAELDPDGKTAAVSLTLVPRFRLPEVEGQEYIFLVDRSGSMGPWNRSGGRIDMARKALVVLLRSLPSTSTSFNIASFGSSVESLWPTSQPYNQVRSEPSSVFLARAMLTSPLTVYSRHRDPSRRLA